MMANQRNGTLYVGVTSALEKRVYEHKSKQIDGFTKKHDCSILVWYELYESMEQAILREKQLKAGSRLKKLALIEKMNSGWNDLCID